MSWQAFVYDVTPVSALDRRYDSSESPVMARGCEADSQSCVSEFGEWAGDAPLACSETAEWVFPDQEIRKILATSLQEIDEVVSVCTQISADESVVWSLLKSYDRNARTRVYEKELEICERLQMYDFDFRVTAIDLVSPAELVAGGFQEIFKR